ncbi:MAG: RluA family pseudouridine synthase [Planctomycetota bacterium]
MCPRPRPPDDLVLHADPWIVVANKPAGVLSIPGRGDAPFLPDLLYAAGIGSDLGPVRVVHRLDRGATGVIVYARTEEAQRLLSEQWKNRTVEKLYLALVQGFVTADGQSDARLLINREKGRVVVDPKQGKKSLTRYRVVERLAAHTLIECTPATGRLHQIRVHMANLGHPLAVDPLYGGGPLFLSRYKPGYRPDRRHDERPLLRRLSLHAASLAFQHPSGTGLATYVAPMPKDFRAAVNQLRRALSQPETR